MKVTLCLLTKNELECLKVILPKIPQPSAEAGYDEIYAIDGGSTDGTIEFLLENKIRVLTQSKKGRGEAFLLALSKIQTDAYIFFSPDGNEDINDLPKFKLLLSDGADLVIASRMCKGAYNEEDDMFLKWRKWANNVFNLMANMVFNFGGKFVTDSINGYRAIKTKSFKYLELDAFDYTIEYQMTMRAMGAGLKIIEFPTIEGKRIAGKTGAPSLPTGLKFIMRFMKELNRKLRINGFK